MSDPTIPGGKEALQTKSRPKVKEPKKYQVVLHNDDYTTMEFVVEVLKQVFRKSPVEAHAIMISVHKKGRGIVGLYPYDIAATKAQQARAMAKRHGFPLKCTIEEAP
jgi:ATP-dependent Clp protease adaptor protein ClpS